jgi:hypothetical protein
LYVCTHAQLIILQVQKVSDKLGISIALLALGVVVHNNVPLVLAADGVYAYRVPYIDGDLGGRGRQTNCKQRMLLMFSTCRAAIEAFG